MSYISSSLFSVIDSFLQELCPQNLEEFEEFFSYPDFSLPSLQLLHWNLLHCFLVKSSSSSSHFGVIDLFLQELDPLNVEEF
jgi:hypothetical protein